MHQDGTVFVLEKGNGRVRIISTDFTTVSSLGAVVGLQNARRILFTPSYNSFIVVSSAIPSFYGSSDDRLMEVRISDSFRLKILGGTPGNSDGVGMAGARFYQPTAMAWTPEGALLVSQYDGAIRIVNWDTETVMTLVAPPTPPTAGTQMTFFPVHSTRSLMLMMNRYHQFRSFGIQADARGLNQHVRTLRWSIEWQRQR